MTILKITSNYPFPEGHIEFKATCEGQKTKPQHPDHYMTLDDDSQSSEATSPPRSSPPRDLESMLNDLQQVRITAA